MKSACVLLCFCMSCTVCAREPEFREAVHQYRHGQFSSAFGRFIVLANDGHRDAARMALFMHQYGPLLYGTHWDASEEDVDRWTQVAGRWPRPGEPERMGPPPAAAKLAPAFRARMSHFQGRKAHVERTR